MRRGGAAAPHALTVSCIVAHSAHALNSLNDHGHCNVKWKNSVLFCTKVASFFAKGPCSRSNGSHHRRDKVQLRRTTSLELYGSVRRKKQEGTEKLVTVVVPLMIGTKSCHFFVRVRQKLQPHPCEIERRCCSVLGYEPCLPLWDGVREARGPSRCWHQL